jgi:hypothetical protein
MLAFVRLEVVVLADADTNVEVVPVRVAQETDLWRGVRPAVGAGDDGLDDD